MNDALNQMLERYQCRSAGDYENALKEIIQELALLGLWRARFFERAAFYGGSALRILYGLNRFSEDLDFSLLARDGHFSLKKYHSAVRDELAGFGLECTVSSIEKANEGQIQSAFIKAGTLIHMINVGAPDAIHKLIPKNKVMAIKFEIDVDPPGKFEVEARNLLQPVPFSVNTFARPDLLAGKIHAVLCRSWKTRVKGRDWYDLVWFVGQKIPVRAAHLKERLVQSGTWSSTKKLQDKDIRALLEERIDQVEFGAASKDVMPFLKDPDSVKLWSRDFFRDVVAKLSVV